MIGLTSTIRRRSGFTLVELAVVVVTIGVLAAFGVPKFLSSVERAKASEGVAYLAAIQSAQERYLTKEGVYAPEVGMLDLGGQPPVYFTAGTMTTTNTGNNPTWSITLTRNAASSSRGAYTISFGQDGFDRSMSSIMAVPEINPFASPGG